MEKRLASGNFFRGLMRLCVVGIGVMFMGVGVYGGGGRSITVEVGTEGMEVSVFDIELVKNGGGGKEKGGDKGKESPKALEWVVFEKDVMFSLKKGEVREIGDRCRIKFKRVKDGAVSSEGEVKLTTHEDVIYPFEVVDKGNGREKTTCVRVKVRDGVAGWVIHVGSDEVDIGSIVVDEKAKEKK